MDVELKKRIDKLFESISSKKVGKKASSVDYYVHVQAIEKGESNINPKLKGLYELALSILNEKEPAFRYDFVNIHHDKRNPKVRFLQMSSLEEAHPVVAVSKVIELNSGKIADGRLNNQIYHRLDTIVSPSHKTYRFHKAVAEYEVEEKKILGQKDTPSNKIGHLKHWEAHINDKYSYTEFLKDIARIKKENGL
jgi:hypothetical protein